MTEQRKETDLERFSRIMHALGLRALHQSAWQSREAKRQPKPLLSEFPFVTLSVLVILITLFVMSMERGGWGWSSWTYSFAFVILVPLVLLEWKRKAIITGGAVILLFFMVVMDAGMPGYFGYSPSDTNWYDNWAHLVGVAGMTLFLWSFLCWTLSPTGPPKTNGRRKFVFAIATMVVISFFFEFTEFFTDAIFGWTNFHPGIDTIGDLIFDMAGITIAGLMIGRHRVSMIRRPFWQANASSE
jgi:hypothetical protein